MISETVKNLLEDFDRKLGQLQENIGKTKKSLQEEIVQKVSALKGVGGNMDEVSKALVAL
jgi:hypothetical protein